MEAALAWIVVVLFALLIWIYALTVAVKHWRGLWHDAVKKTDDAQRENHFLRAKCDLLEVVLSSVRRAVSDQAIQEHHRSAVSVAEQRRRA